MWYLFAISLLAILLYIGMPMSNEYWNEPNTNKYSVQMKIMKFYFFWFILLVLTAFRSRSVGNDTGAYLDLFNRISINGVNRNLRYEIGFQWFNFILGKVTKLPQSIIITSALFSYGLIAYYYKKYCVAPLLAIICFYALFFSEFTNTIRLAMASCILLFSFESIRKGKSVRAVFFLIMAVLFHNAAIVFTPYLLIVIFKIKFREKLFRIVAIVFFILCISSNFLIYVLKAVIPSLSSYYSLYLSGERVGSGWLGIVFLIIKLGIIWFGYTFTVSQDERENNTLWLYAFALLLYISSFIMNLFDRLASIYMFLLIVPTINEMIKSKKILKEKYIHLMLCGLIILFLIENVLRPEWNVLYPYTFF